MRFIVVIEYDVPPDVEHPPGLGLVVDESGMSPGVRVVRADALIREPADLVADVVAESQTDEEHARHGHR
jgi:hypothetical protein